MTKELFRNTTTFTLIIISFFFLFDIGNVDALRQGTEGFYLKISNEMYKNSSFLTPLHLGEPHWSKPPLHFWLAYIGYSLTGGTSLFVARAVVALVSLGSLLYFSFWAKKHLKVSPALTLVFFAGTLGLIKYSRIYMMEIPLSLLSAISSLFFFNYLYSHEKKQLLWATLFLALASLVKGPVAIVMCIGGVGIFALVNWFQQGRLFFKEIFLWGLFSVILSSIWYLVSYSNHGMEFFNYFFVRENLGKFTARSYPISSVIQGLLIYGAPVTFFLFIIFDKGHWKRTFNSRVSLYLFCHFAFIFILWMIPNQRSHHYAIPALPFFLMYMLGLLSQYSQQRLKNDWRIYLPAYLEIGFLTLLFLISLLALTFPEVSMEPLNLFRIGLTIICLATAIYFLIARKSLYQMALAGLISFGTVYVLFAPTFYLPTVPERIVQKVRGKPLAVQFRKPYFIQEAVGQEIRILDFNNLNQSVPGLENGYVLMLERIFNKKNLAQHLEIVERWPIWRRGNGAEKIFNAISDHDLDRLKSHLILAKPLKY